MNEATAPDISVKVRVQYLPAQSDPTKQHFVFAYHICITNHSDVAVQLLNRRWLITDGQFKQQEVSGEGVVGKKPRIAPGQKYEYSSGCVLETEVGTMAGHYGMVTEAGEEFNTPIPQFVLAAPRTLH